MFGLFRFYAISADHMSGREVAEQMLTLAQRSHDADTHVFAKLALGANQLFRGEFNDAMAHLQYVIEHADKNREHELAILYGDAPIVLAHGFLAECKVVLGYPEQGLHHAQSALELAAQLDFPICKGFALSILTFVNALCGKFADLQHSAAELIALSKQHEFPHYLSNAKIFSGWASVKQGNLASISTVQQGIDEYSRTGSELDRGLYLCMLIETYINCGQIQAGLETVEEGMQFVSRSCERITETKLYRLKGELLHLKQHSLAEIEDSMKHALHLARQQKVKWLELNTAVSLAQIWQQKDQSSDVHLLLEPIYGWFTEGFDLPLMQTAKQLLDDASTAD
jgi:hypothetical protein